MILHITLLNCMNITIGTYTNVLLDFNNTCSYTRQSLRCTFFFRKRSNLSTKRDRLPLNESSRALTIFIKHVTTRR
jgi:hypothetical protein